MALPATEAFTGSGALSASWTQVGWSAQTLQRTSDQGKASAVDSGHDVGAIWTGDTFGNDQYSQVKVVSGLSSGANYAQVGVRATGTGGSLTGYYFFTDGASGTGHTGIMRYDAGDASSREILAISTTVAAGDVIRLEVSGSTLTAKKNGTTVGTVADATYASGSAWVSLYNNSANNVVLDDWEGGNLSATGGGSYTLTAAGGSFVLTGSSAGTLFNRVLSAGSGSFVLTGADALRDLSMAADSASFVLTGADATLTYNTSSGGTVNGQTLTATLSLIAGSVNAGALVSGSTVSTTLSLLSGSVNAGAAVSGQTVSSTMSLVAGSISAGSLVSGTTLITNLSLVAGSASAVQNATVNGYVFITNMSLITGNAFTDGTVKVYNRLLFSPVQPLIRPLIEKIINYD